MKLPAGLLASPAVAPLPVRSPFELQMTAELDALQSDHDQNSSINLQFLLDALIFSITTQRIALDSLSNLDLVYGDSDGMVIHEYINQNDLLLDACNGMSEKVYLLQNYVVSLRMVSHLLEGKYCPIPPSTLVRARRVLDSCEAIERSTSSCTVSASLKKVATKKKLLTQPYYRTESTELRQILSGSGSVASMVCGLLGVALSLKQTRGLQTTPLRYCQSSSTATWFRELHKRFMKEENTVTELREIVKVSRELRQQIKCKKQSSDDEIVRVGAQELKRRCEELQEGIETLEERIKQMYKHLISVRMALLDILSHD